MFKKKQIRDTFVYLLFRVCFAYMQLQRYDSNDYTYLYVHCTFPGCINSSGKTPIQTQKIDDYTGK
mgnify:CR=1 FL=1